MANSYFRFKQFTIYHDRCAMKVTTDGCLFGAWCAKEISTEKNGQTILDIGTGTGLLSLMVAQKNRMTIDAIEIDKTSADQAIENIAASPWKENIHVHCINVLDFELSNQYDVIISNPPFYEKEIESADAGKNKAHHGHGLRLQELLQVIKKGLKPGGKFFLLFPYKRMKEIETAFKKEGLYIEKKLMAAQSVHHLPFRTLIKGKQQPASTETVSISIKDEQQQYTNEFQDLLRDYYLYL